MKKKLFIKTQMLLTLATVIRNGITATSVTTKLWKKMILLNASVQSLKVPDRNRGKCNKIPDISHHGVLWHDLGKALHGGFPHILGTTQQLFILHHLQHSKTHSTGSGVPPKLQKHKITLKSLPPAKQNIQHRQWGFLQTTKTQNNIKITTSSPARPTTQAVGFPPNYENTK